MFSSARWIDGIDIIPVQYKRRPIDWLKGVTSLDQIHNTESAAADFGERFASCGGDGSINFTLSHMVPP
jgi:hypothetical protein